MADLNAIVEQLDQLTLLEASQLSKMLQEKWGVSAAAPVAVGGGGAAAVVEEVEEQTEFDVILVDGGANRIGAIKAVRELTGLGLREAKAAVEEVPSKIREAVTREEADAARTKLEEAGAKVEVR